MFGSRLKAIALLLGMLAVGALVMTESRLGQAQNRPTCISEVEAKRLAMAHAVATYCQLPFDSEEDRELCEDAKSRVASTWFNEQAQRWVATLWEGYCAPAAQCWSGIYISCDGTVTSFEGGED